jgi:hypothetical protein
MTSMVIISLPIRAASPCSSSYDCPLCSPLVVTAFVEMTLLEANIDRASPSISTLVLYHSPFVVHVSSLSLLKLITPSNQSQALSRPNKNHTQSTIPWSTPHQSALFPSSFPKSKVGRRRYSMPVNISMSQLKGEGYLRPSSTGARCRISGRSEFGLESECDW